MKIIRESHLEPPKLPQSIEEFADKYNLTMKVVRRGISNLPKFYAHFVGVDIKNGNILSATYGDGSTEKEAIDAYAKAISQKLIVVNAMHRDRREINVPILYYKKTKKRNHEL